MTSQRCPGDSQLKAFSLGNLSGSSFEKIADHVGQCAQCEATLHDLDSHCDELVTELRQLKAGAAIAPQPEELVHLARSAARRGVDAGSTSVALDPGKRFAKKLADGPCRLGRFNLLAELGVGSFGYVFRAYDSELDRTVAIKIQRSTSLAGDEDVDQFLHEARSAAQLKHPSIVSLYEIGHTEEGVYYLVNEFVEGETLEARLKRQRPTSLQAAEQIALLADALQYAHEHGVIHRDIKPSNILLDAENRPHLMDFGLAKLEAGDMTRTPDGQVMGTPAYMSPEQARGDSRSADARSDLYALGVVFYEMLTGERPFQGNRRMLLLQVLEDEPRPPRQLNDRIPRDLETICLKAMAKSPGRRYATARELADDLRRFAAGEPILARPVGPFERLIRWRRRNPLAVSVLVAVIFGSATGLWHLSSLSEYFVQQTALDSARMESQMLDAMNTFYSEIVDRVDPKTVPITEEYLTRHGAIPLPATFTIDAGERISKVDGGMEVRLYSRYPWRPNGGPKDEFEQAALETLEQNPAEPYHEFTRINGRPSLIYATARRMEESCVKCHNAAPKSPKKDWKVGEVVGVLKIVRSLDRDIERTQQGLRGAFVVIAGMTTLLLGLCAVFLLGARARSRAKAARP